MTQEYFSVLNSRKYKLKIAYKQGAIFTNISNNHKTDRKTMMNDQEQSSFVDF